MENSKILEEELIKKAKSIRKKSIEMVYMASSGHPGGALSIADILTTLYFVEMNVSGVEDNSEGDKLILSKGHAVVSLYATLCERGFLREEDLKSFRRINGMLQGHPDKNKVPGIDMSTGSLGQGLSVAVGHALSSKLDNSTSRTYCILGDGELQEGQIWEAAMSASHYKLDNLCVIVDNNNLQIDGPITEVMNVLPIDKKFESFGFNVITTDGHDFNKLITSFEEAKTVKGKPTCIICKTIKGKGVSFMENQVKWHGKAPNDEEYTKAMAEFI